MMNRPTIQGSYLHHHVAGHRRQLFMHLFMNKAVRSWRTNENNIEADTTAYTALGGSTVSGTDDGAGGGMVVVKVGLELFEFMMMVVGIWW